MTLTQVERKPTAAALVTSYEYDTAGNLTAVKRPAGNRTSAVVNAAGEVTTRTDPLGHASSFTYDLAGRMTKITTR